jgi:hypothetical protein
MVIIQKVIYIFVDTLKNKNKMKNETLTLETS